MNILFLTEFETFREAENVLVWLLVHCLLSDTNENKRSLCLSKCLKFSQRQDIRLCTVRTFPSPARHETGAGRQDYSRFVHFFFDYITWPLSMRIVSFLWNVSHFSDFIAYKLLGKQNNKLKWKLRFWIWPQHFQRECFQWSWPESGWGDERGRYNQGICCCGGWWKCWQSRLVTFM